MATNDEDVALPFVRRREKNLAYFKKYRPELYAYFKDLELNHIELVVTPGLDDVDLTDHGRSVYRNLARSFSQEEAEKFLAENPPDKKMLTLAPPVVQNYSNTRFASRAVRRCFAHSEVTRENFRGYVRGKAFPSIVFLGCGLAYHIDHISRKADVIDAVVFEPDAERFAASLYAVDWEQICTRFRKKGRSISFSIAVSTDSNNVKRVLGDKLREIVPLYPFLTVYYNHMVNVELFRAAQEIEQDMPILAANWGSYDFEIRGFNNAVHNIRSDGRYIRSGTATETDRPVFIVGSGPSIDTRLADLLRFREKAIVISAGTGLRALVSHGIKPDFHVELDADYLIYEILKDLGSDALRGVTLIAAIDVNPLLPTLFDNTMFYFKKKSYIPGFFDVAEDAIDYTNPTCTNAAIAVSHTLGFTRFLLFGTDYGFREKAQHHSQHSVYGSQARTNFSVSFQGKQGVAETQRSTFEVPAVDGGTVLTRNDYFSARRQLEDFIYDAARGGGSPIEVYNCADGAVIDGAPWLAPDEFHSYMEKCSDVAQRETGGLRDRESMALPVGQLDEKLDQLSAELKMNAQAYLALADNARLNGRQDLVVLANEIRSHLNRVGTGSGKSSPVQVQAMGYQMLKGTVHHFLYVGLCHGLAYENDADLIRFSKGWRQEFRRFFKEMPAHFDRVVHETGSVEDDPWVRQRLTETEYGLDRDTGSVLTDAGD